MPPDQVGKSDGSPEKVHPLSYAEVMPAGKVTALPAEKGNLFQRIDNRSRRSHYHGRIKIGLSFEISHEKTHDIAKIDKQADQHGYGQDQI